MSVLRNLYRRNAFIRWAIYPIVMTRRLWLMRHAHATHQVFSRLSDALAEDPVLAVNGFPGTYAFGPRSDLFRNVVMSGGYETAWAELCRKHVDQQRDAIDIGANIGLYSVLLASLLPSRRVLAIEPTPDAARRLRANIERNDCSATTIVFQGVASDHKGSAEIRMIPGKEEYSSCGRMTHAAIVGLPHVSIAVEAATIDDLVAQHSLDPGFIKIDVEGMEHVVLGGMRDVLSQCQPVILTEISDSLLRHNGSSSAALFDLLRSFGYRILHTNGEELRSGTRLEGEILCVAD
jgi:FkbM family methyltransferase